MNKMFRRGLALALAMVMVLGLGVSGVQAAPRSEKITFEKLDNVSTDLFGTGARSLRTRMRSSMPTPTWSAS